MDVHYILQETQERKVARNVANFTFQDGILRVRDNTGGFIEVPNVNAIRCEHGELNGSLILEVTGRVNEQGQGQEQGNQQGSGRQGTSGRNEGGNSGQNDGTQLSGESPSLRQNMPNVGASNTSAGGTNAQGGGQGQGQNQNQGQPAGNTSGR